MAIHADAQVDPAAYVHSSVVAWQGTHIRERAIVGAGSSLGQYVYVGPGAVIGSNCKIQNGAMIYEPAVLGDGVFIGPRVVLTNDLHPRAVTPSGIPKSADDWTPVGVTIEYGASIGAGAVCVAPVTIGEWATVAAGAVVVNDVPSYALVGGVPARRIGWVGRSGVPLEQHAGRWRCPVTAEEFVEVDGGKGLELVRS